MDMNEWKTLSILVPTGNVYINELDMLGFQDFDTNHECNHTEISRNTLEKTPTYINYKWKSGEVIQDNNPLPNSTNALSHNQQLAFDIVLQHSQVQGPKEPLRMIIKGTTSTCKSCLIDTIKNVLSC